MKVIHIVARANAARRPFEDPEAAAWAWEHLRDAFPCVLVAALMPTHAHLVAAVEDPAASRERLARLLGRLGIRFAPGVNLWERVPEPKVLVGRKEILTAIRYVVLNPCHARLVDDPLLWWWSTQRDLLGACVDPWVKPEDLAPIFECRPKDVAQRVHAYVTGDRKAVPGESPFPRPAPLQSVGAFSLDAIEAAVAASMRIPRAAVRETVEGRRLFATLARAHGWTNGTVLAQALDVERSTIYKMRTAPPQWSAAASLCLGDARLSSPCGVEGVSAWSTAAAAGLQSRINIGRVA